MERTTNSGSMRLATYDETLKDRWVQRAWSKRHLVESVTAGRLHTNCGRWLTASGWGEDAPSSNGLDRPACKQCLP